MLAEDTIAAISTPPGEGAIAVIRISGSQAIAIAEQLFARANSGHPLVERRLHFGCFRGREEKLDEGMAVVFRAPHSYTGEDMAEFHCHGGVLVASRLLEAARGPTVLDRPLVGAGDHAQHPIRERIHVELGARRERRCPLAPREIRASRG